MVRSDIAEKSRGSIHREQFPGLYLQNYLKRLLGSSNLWNSGWQSWLDSKGLAIRDLISEQTTPTTATRTSLSSTMALLVC